MEIFIVLAAAFMVFFGYKEYELTRQAEQLREERILAEQIQAEKDTQAGDEGDSAEQAAASGRQSPEEQAAPAEGQQSPEEQAAPAEGQQSPEEQTAQTEGQQSPEEQTARAGDQEAPAQPAAETSIRVLLMNSAQDSYVQEQVIVQSAVPLEISGASVQEWAADTPLNAGELVGEGDVVRISPQRSGGEMQDQEDSAAISVLSLERSQGTPSYEGVLEISRRADGLYVVNQVELETYLKYVVPSEMPSDYPAEALKAQAVCARTYAVRQMQERRLAEYGADVDDTVSYQVYNNISRQPTTDQAVDDTAGEIICWNHEPIQAYFFSTSCGFTSSDQVWMGGTQADYLKSVSLSQQSVEALASGTAADSLPDAGWENGGFEQYILGKNTLDYESEEPWYRWEICLPWEELERRAEAEYPQIGSLQDFQIRERSDGGAVTKLALIGSGGEAVLENEYRIREFLSPGRTAVTLQNGTTNTSMKILPSAYIALETVTEDDRPSGLYIRGGGYGHGVGMSQNGAKCLARDGMDWEQILSVFYRGTTIESVSAASVSGGPELSR